MGVCFPCYHWSLHWLPEIADPSYIHLTRAVKSRRFDPSQQFSGWLLQRPIWFCVNRSLSSGKVQRNRIFQAPFRIFSSCLPTDICKNTAQFCTDSLWSFFLLILEVKYKFHRDKKKAELYFCQSEWSILVPLLLNINWANLNKGVLNCKDTTSFPKTRNLYPLYNPQNRFNEKNNCRNSHENVHVYSPWMTSLSILLDLIQIFL